MATDVKLRSVIGAGNNNLKAAQLFTPRSKVYVEANNTQGPLEDSTLGTDNMFSLNTLAFGSTATVRIPPTYPLIREVILNAKVDLTYTANSAQTDHAPDCTYWLYRLIKAFTYRLGNADKVRFEGYNLPFIINDQCDSWEKREILLESCGEGCEYYPANKAVTRSFHLSAILPLPCSTPSVWKKPKPLPIYMCNQSLELEIEWEQAANVTNLITAGPNTAAGTVLSVAGAEIKVIYETLGSANQLKASPYLYPFQYHQHMTYPVRLLLQAAELSKYKVVPSVTANSYASLGATFTMIGLRQGETSQFMFRVAKRDPVYLPQNFTHADANVYTATDATRKCNDIYAGLKLSKIDVLFGGQSIYQANYKGLTEVFEEVFNFLPNRLPGRKRGISSGSFFKGLPYQSIITTGTATTAVTMGTTDGTGALNTLDGLGPSYGPIAGALEQRNQTIISEPFQLKNRWNNGDNRAVNVSTHHIRENRPAGFYYHIPIAEILDHVRGQDYALGADFERGEIQVSFVVDSDYYREMGQGFWVENANSAQGIFEQEIPSILNGTPTLYKGQPDPDMARTVDLVDGLLWPNRTYDDTYQVYAMASTNGIYHFSGQNVQRIS